MKVNLGVVATAATREPSRKAVQKAQAVLKNASKAKAEKSASKIKGLFSKFSEKRGNVESRDNELKAAVKDAERVLYDFTTKAKTEEKKLEAAVQKAEKTRADFSQSVTPKLVDLAKAVVDADKIHVETFGKSALTDAQSKQVLPLVQSEKKKAKKSKPTLGRGLKDLSGGSKKSGRALDMLTKPKK